MCFSAGLLPKLQKGLGEGYVHADLRTNIGSKVHAESAIHLMNSFSHID
jgi:hypothetical protein